MAQEEGERDRGVDNEKEKLTELTEQKNYLPILANYVPVLAALTLRFMKGGKKC